MADAKITLEQVRHVAKLARLALSEDEARRHKPRVVLVDEANRIVEAEHPFMEKIYMEGMLI